MSLPRLLTKRKAEVEQNPLENDRPLTYTANLNITSAPTVTLSGRDSTDETESSLTNTLGVAETSEITTPIYSNLAPVW
jgi:hypothetical protein